MRSMRFTLAAAVAVVLLVGCTDDKAKNSDPLPTQAVGDACGFVSKSSAETALGQSGLEGQGLKQDLGGGATNPDGSRLNLAGCKFFTKDGNELSVSVKPIGIPPYEERVVPTLLKAGGAPFVFPAAEGQGVAIGQSPDGAAIARLIRGDWYYVVTLSKPVKGRDGVADVVAILRQVVGQLGLPQVEKLPRPTATPGS